MGVSVLACTSSSARTLGEDAERLLCSLAASAQCAASRQATLPLAGGRPLNLDLHPKLNSQARRTLRLREPPAPPSGRRWAGAAMESQPDIAAAPLSASPALAPESLFACSPGVAQVARRAHGHVTATCAAGTEHQYFLCAAAVHAACAARVPCFVCAANVRHHAAHSIFVFLFFKMMKKMRDVVCGVLFAALLAPSGAFAPPALLPASTLLPAALCISGPGIRKHCSIGRPRPERSQSVKAQDGTSLKSYFIVIFCSAHTRALTVQNFCKGDARGTESTLFGLPRKDVALPLFGLLAAQFVLFVGVGAGKNDLLLLLARSGFSVTTLES